MSIVKQIRERIGGVGAASLLLLGLVVTPFATTSSALADGFFDSIFPLGQRSPPPLYPTKAVPFKSAKDLPVRPKLGIEVGDGFLDTGKLDAGFETPWGAVWQPRLWGYMINRTAVQHFENSTRSNTEIANRMDLFVNLQLTGTEKILLNLRPTDSNRPGQFSRYSFNDSQGGEGFVGEYAPVLEAFFFEGDLGSLFPKLDPGGIKPIDYGYTIGRQALNFQEGILLNDTIDMFGLVRNNLYAPGVSSLRISGMYGWRGADRGESDSHTDTFGLFTSADLPHSTVNLDMIYVADENVNGDAFYAGLSSIQRIGRLNTAFRINGSIAFDEDRAGVADGVLLTAELAMTPHNSDDNFYFNPYVGIRNFTQAGREPIVGGPLGALGVLFASPNLGNYASELSSFTDEVAGFATGYQAFWDNHRRNLVLELATRKDISGDADKVDSLAVGFQMQQAIGRHFQVQLEGFYAFVENQKNSTGMRLELQIVY
jgi:hypothetical protein